MSGLANFKDIVDLIQGKAVTPDSQASNAASAPVPWEEILHKELGSQYKVNQFKSLMVSAGIFKDVTSVDLGPVRIVSLYPIIAQIANTEFKFLTMLKQKSPYRATDFQIRIPQEDIGTDILPAFNVDGTLPAVKQSILTERTNTLMAVGQQIQVSFMASELAAQSPYRRDELAAQLQKAMLRIDRTENALLLNNTEQTSEALPNIPNAGGFVNRSTLYNVATGGSNLTDAFISNQVTSLASRFGYDQLQGDLVALTNNAQVSVVRSLMINRYPGNQPMAKLEYDTELARQVAKLGVPVQMMYEDNNAMPIPFIREMQLPAGTTVIFRPSLPQMAKFQMQGSFGPWVVERPITNLYRLDVAFDLFSLVDPLVESRSVLTGHP